jgi:FKBP-type peptidyl-prolyl cis-trans isomerase
MQVTSTGIAIALAIAVALGLLFFGPRFFAPAAVQQVVNPANIAPAATTTTTMDTTGTTAAAGAQALPIPNPLPTQLTATDQVVGTGAEAVAGKQVTVNYVGMLPDGTVFDASSKHGQAFTFPLGAHKVITGWDQGVVGMKVGGKRRLIVPPADGYGAQGVPGVIPANATLIFDVELVGVQ